MSDIVQDLRNIQEKYKNDIVSVGRISISEMAKGCADHIEHLQSENTRLKAERDKAVEDLESIQEDGFCCVCKFIGSCTDKEDCCFKWRGSEDKNESE